MKNNKRYFALRIDGAGNLRKEYPLQVYPFIYQGYQMFTYLASIGQYNVCCGTTGLPIATSKYSRIDAMQQARDKINEKGIDKIIADIKLAEKVLNTAIIYEEIEE